ncbi:thioredoxin-disulfide reductase [Desulfoscipio gibsoniae]|uniref:Thioredoxin reductase n=1 Tax=Desulfoscipio gibsoniae DSM 7213 TaxID=767817 RepID=R4KE56_9FIRM|nr:thioredoxin-disulfide reductase [Desulfoscipio gibsoniae]AGL01453.1 thioredoxin-disulfide reductase [Desulfoscipio gibsoniae DSM 7213]
MHIYDVTIIGGGPAGLAAGIYSSRAALKTLLLEKGMPGGLAASTEFIENYPGFAEGVGGPELMMQMDAQARRFGMEVQSANAETIEAGEDYFTIKTDDGAILTKTIILATGAQPQKLKTPGEEEFHGRGVSYCATCDGAFFRDKEVAVIGGGDSAVEEAIYLTKFASKVHIIHRRGELRATKVLQQRAMDNEKIVMHWHSVVEKISGEATVKEIIIKDVRSGETKPLAVDGIFIYVGTRPVSDLVAGLINLDQRGYIIADENMHTSRPGIFAAGDVRQKILRQVVTAVADGAIAAVSAEKYIEETQKK